MKKRFFQSFFLQVNFSVLCRWILKIIVGVEFGNSKFLKSEKQFIILANHNSHLDTVGLLASLPAGIIWRVKPVAAEDYFGNTKFKAAFSNYFINTLLIRRKPEKNGGHNPIKKITKALDEGYSLIFFPEGTRGKAEQMDELKPGIAHILSKYPHIPYVPVFLTGMGRSLPKGKLMVLPYKSSVNYGKPTYVENKNIGQIMEQIIADFEEMREKYQPVIIEDDDE